MADIDSKTVKNTYEIELLKGKAIAVIAIGSVMYLGHVLGKFIDAVGEARAISYKK